MFFPYSERPWFGLLSINGQNYKSCNFLARSRNWEKRPLASSCLSAWNNLDPTERIFMKSDIRVFFENLSRAFKFHWNLTIIKGTLHEDQYTFLIICRSVLLRMRNVSDKSRVNRAICEIIWKNTVQPDRAQITIWCMRTACWIPKATNTHSEYVILIVFPLQQWLHEHASMLRYMYIACLVVTRFTVSCFSTWNVLSLHTNFPSHTAQFHHSSWTEHVTEDGTSKILHTDDAWADFCSVMSKIKRRDE